MAAKRRRSRKPRTNIETTFEKLLKRAVEVYGNKFSLDELHALARREVPTEYSSERLDEAVQKYVALGYLARDGSEVIVTHRFADLIANGGVGQRTLLDFVEVLGPQVSTLDEIFAKLERSDELTIPQLYKLIYDYGIEVSDVLIKVAFETDFFDRDPRELLVEFLESCVHEHNELVELLRSTTARKRRAILESSIKRLRKILHAVFQRYLGIPVGPRSYDLINIPIRPEEFVEADYENVKRWLEKRIIDDKVVVPIEIRRGNSYAGIDASSLRIRPPLRRGRFPEIRIFTSVSVVYKPDGSSAPEVQPKPERIAGDNLASLEREGFVVRGSDILTYSDYYIDRITETLMQKRVYNAAEELYSRVDRPEVIHLDGRIWPTEHKVSDFFAEHKEYVRAMLSSFQKLISAVKYYGQPVTGVVKRGHLGFLWYLVFWYAYKNGFVSRENFILEPQIYESLENRDGAVALWILLLYFNKTGRYGRLFSVWRKMYTADLDETGDSFFGTATLRGIDPLDAENDYSFWYEVAEELVVRRAVGATIDDVEKFLEGRTTAVYRVPSDVLEAVRSLDSDERRRLAKDLAGSERYSEKLRILEKRLGCQILSVEDRNFIPLLADIYAFGDVVTFYFLPPLEYESDWVRAFVDSSEFDPESYPNISLPRFDLLLPVRDILLTSKSPNETKERIVELINRTTIGAPDEKAYCFYDISEGTRWNLIVPTAVHLAHKFSKYINREEVVKQYVGLVLATLYALYREERGDRT